MATNEQIAEMLSEGTGTSISAGTLDPTKGSKRLSWEDITERFARRTSSYYTNGRYDR